MKKATRENILEQAARAFSLNGYKETNIRDILRKANANVAAINYYFGSKRGLYIEILQNVLKRFSSQFESVFNDYQALKPKMPAPTESKALLKTFIKYLVSLACSDDVDSIIFIREYMDPSDEYKEVFGGFNDFCKNLFETLLADASGNTVSKEQNLLTTMMAYSFILTVYTRKQVICRDLKWPGYDAKAKDEIAKTIYRSISGVIGIS